MRLSYKLYLTYFKSLLIISLIYQIICKNLLNIKLFIIVILVIK